MNTQKFPARFRAWGSVALSFLVLVALAGCPPAELRPPRASFSLTPAGGLAPLAVQFTDLSDPGSSPITNWFWNFGDATTGTGPNPSHTYRSVGRYTVTLRVVSAVGEGITALDKIVEVLPPPISPKARFEADPVSGRAPLIVQFTDTSAPGERPITTYRWDFGDGSRSTQTNPAHTYAEPGTYGVSLTVSNSVGESTFTEDGLITVFD